LARREVYALREHVAEERAVAVGVALLRIVEVAHRPVVHEQRRHRADALHVSMPRKAGFEPRRLPLELAVDALVAQPPQYRQAGCGCEWVSGQRSRLVDVAA